MALITLEACVLAMAINIWCLQSRLSLLGEIQPHTESFCEICKFYAWAL